MNTRTNRGRTVQPRRSSLRPFYIAFVLVAVLGVGLIGVVVARQRPVVATSDITTSTTQSLNLPTGTTTDGYAYKGSPDAPVTVVEYADFQCPACALVYQRIEPTIDQQYIATGKVRMVFQDFPLSQHQHAVPAAVAARCALQQDAFWPMHDRLFSTQGQWATMRDPRATFAGYAADLGLNTQSYNACVAAPTTTQQIQASFDGGIAAGVNATPTFFVDGTAVDASGLQAAIEAALRAKGQ